MKDYERRPSGEELRRLLTPRDYDAKKLPPVHSKDKLRPNYGRRNNQES
jgi:hypothetical protein